MRSRTSRTGSRAARHHAQRAALAARTDRPRRPAGPAGPARRDAQRRRTAGRRLRAKPGHDGHGVDHQRRASTRSTSTATSAPASRSRPSRDAEQTAGGEIATEIGSGSRTRNSVFVGHGDSERRADRPSVPSDRELLMVRGPKTSLSPDSLAYLAELAAQDEVLARVERETSEMPRSMMQVSPDQGALMQVLVAAIGARNALEVGTFTGYSAICIARGLGDRGSSRAWSSRTSTRTSLSGTSRRPGVEDRVDIVRGPAGESLASMPEEPTLRLRVPGRRQDRLSRLLRADPPRG